MAARAPALHAVPESALTPALAAGLPHDGPPAPWTATLQAVVWLHRATPAARAQLAPGQRDAPALPVTVGALVRYLESPVGPYGEVLAAPVLLAGLPLPEATVPFIAVDSAASVRGGRVNWALPKVLATFDWSATPDAAARPAAFRVAVRGDVAADAPWSVDAAVHPRRRALPVRLALRARQPPPGGRIPIALAGTVHPARVEVRTDGPTLPDWLRAGRHHGLFLPRARAVFGTPSP